MVGRRRSRNLAGHRYFANNRLGDLAGLNPKRRPRATQLEALVIQMRNQLSLTGLSGTNHAIALGDPVNLNPTNILEHVSYVA